MHDYDYIYFRDGLIEMRRRIRMQFELAKMRGSTDTAFAYSSELMLLDDIISFLKELQEREPEQ